MKKNDLSIFSKGTGRPKVLLISGIHGNELSGIAVVIKAFKEISPSRGTFSIIPCVNIKGICLQRRSNPEDNLDLNRVFFDKSQESSTKTLMIELLEIAKQYDLVIDLHNFFGRGFMTVIVSENEVRNIKDTALELAKTFGPDVIRIKRKEQHKGRLCPELRSKGVPCFTVELPHQITIQKKDLDKAIAGIREILFKLGMLKKSSGKAPNPTIVTTRGVRTKITGLFLPEVTLGQYVKSGEKVGEVVNLETLEESDVYSPADGQVQSNPNIKFVPKGLPIMAIGKPSVDEKKS